MKTATALTVDIATDHDLDDIRRLNHRTFAGEIPQHAPRPDGRLVDRFEAHSIFIIAREHGQLVGMLAMSDRRPFSIDFKLQHVDSYLPPGRRPCEIRLLAVEPTRRHGMVLRALLSKLVTECDARGLDLAVISATTRQLRLYAHLGCVPFGPIVGTTDAAFQPMYITREALLSSAGASLGHSEPARVEPACFRTGPVPLSPRVQARLHEPLRPHRGPEFSDDLFCVRRAMRGMTGAPHVAVFAGSGTLANDAVAAQIARSGAPAVICSNGEFGDRLIDHARRHGIVHDAVRVPWGTPLPHERIVKAAQRSGARWIWAVHHETSTGMLNRLEDLREVASLVNARLALDAASSVGTVPMSLDGVAFASTVSGKAIGSVAGLAMVCCAEVPERGDGRLPRYLDLSLYLDGDGVPFTQSSLLVGALATALCTTDWAARYAAIARSSALLRERLAHYGYVPLVSGANACPAVATWQAGSARDTAALGALLRRAGFALSWESGYLRARQWLQTSFMGAFDETAVTPMADELARVLSLSLAS